MDAIVKHKLPIHPAANLIPEMTADEYQGLLNDIAVHGQRDPITMFNGAILDGRHRYRATQELGLDPLTETWSGNAPEPFVISRNLKRRHLTTSQRALLAAEYAKAPVGKSAKLRDKVPTVAEAAKLFVVSERSIHTARHIAEHAPAATVAKIRAGLISLNEADQQTREPTDPAIAGSPSMRRQEWLETAMLELRPWFKDAGYTVPTMTRVSIGLGGRHAGLHYSPKGSSDGHHEIFIAPITDDSIEIIGTLAHEMVHAAVGNEARHGPAFKACALAVGLEGKMTSTDAGPTLREWATSFMERHGPYPGGALERPVRPRRGGSLENGDWQSFLDAQLSSARTASDLLPIVSDVAGYPPELVAAVENIVGTWGAILYELQSEKEYEPVNQSEVVG